MRSSASSRSVVVLPHAAASVPVHPATRGIGPVFLPHAAASVRVHPATRGIRPVFLPTRGIRHTAVEVAQKPARDDLRELDDELELDRRVERQHRDADGRTRVTPGFAEQLPEQLGRAVDDTRLAGE